MKMDHFQKKKGLSSIIFSGAFWLVFGKGNVNAILALLIEGLNPNYTTPPDLSVRAVATAIWLI